MGDSDGSAPDDGRTRDGEGRRDAVLADALARLRRLGASTATAYLLTADGALAAAVVLDSVLSFTVAPRMAVDDMRYVSVMAHRTGRRATLGPEEVQRTIVETPSLVQQVPYSMFTVSVPLRMGQRGFGVLTLRWVPAREVPRESLDHATRVADEAAVALSELAGQGVSMEAPVIPFFAPEEGADDDVAGQDGFSSSAFLYQMQKLGGRLSSARRVADVVAATRSEVVRPFGGRAMTLCVAERGRLRVIGSSGVSRDELRQVDGLLLTAGSPETDALLKVRPLVFATAGELRSAYPELDRYQDDSPRTFLPLVANDRPVGCCVMISDRPGGLRDEELAILMIMLGQVGQSLDRARSYEIEHSIAQGMQRALLPRDLPPVKEMETAARYLPATAGTEVGGDWYDVIRLADGGVGMIIGDVEGHALDALGIMGQLRSGVRAYATEGHDPASVLTRSNRLLAELDTDLFATCCCMWLNLETGAATVASAGHHAPLVTDARGGAEPVRLPVGPPLGVDPGTAYLQTEISIPPGGIVALYTDGLLDGRGIGVETSVDRLLGCLAADSRAEHEKRENVDVLADRLIALTHTEPHRDDDTALLLMRYRGTQETTGRVAHLSVQHHDVRHVRHLRRFLGDLMADWGLAELTEDLEVLASEVVTNALIHTSTDVDVRLREYPDRLRVEVRDNDPRPPVPAVNLDLAEPADDEAESGRGLLIVDVLASAWGSSPTGRGKTTWFELDRPASAGSG